ncbi:MAG: hypothetical protein ACLSE7_02760 [Lachnospirales bacterium]
MKKAIAAALCCGDGFFAQGKQKIIFRRKEIQEKFTPAALAPVL